MNDAPAPGAWTAFGGMLRRDCRLALRSRAELGVVLLFDVIVVVLFPLGTGADPAMLREIGPAIVWVAALLASLVSLPRLFAGDLADGSLEQIALSPAPLPALASGKIAAHWMTTGLPLAALSPLLGLAFHLSAAELAALAASLLIGTPLLSLIGAVGAALTLGLRAAGGLLALLVLPLCVPVLIFGASAVSAVRDGSGPAGELSIIGAMLAAGIVGVPFATAAALRIALD